MNLLQLTPTLIGVQHQVNGVKSGGRSCLHAQLTAISHPDRLLMLCGETTCGLNGLGVHADRHTGAGGGDGSISAGGGWGGSGRCQVLVGALCHR